MPRPTFTRRTFLTASSLALFAPEILADILKGPNPTRHGQRDRNTWLGATALEWVRLGPKRGDMQPVFKITRSINKHTKSYAARCNHLKAIISIPFFKECAS